MLRLGMGANAGGLTRCRGCAAGLPPTHPLATYPHPLPSSLTHLTPPPQPTPTPQRGILEKYGVELIGAKLESINKAEDRDLFAQVGAHVCLS